MNETTIRGTAAALAMAAHALFFYTLTAAQPLPDEYLARLGVPHTQRVEPASGPAQLADEPRDPAQTPVSIIRPSELPKGLTIC